MRPEGPQKPGSVSSPLSLIVAALLERLQHLEVKPSLAWLATRAA
jgi:hypothetical protein